MTAQNSWGSILWFISNQFQLKYFGLGWRWAWSCDLWLFPTKSTGEQKSNSIKKEPFDQIVNSLQEPLRERNPIWHSSLSPFSKSNNSHPILLSKHINKTNWFLKLFFIIPDFSKTGLLFIHTIFSASSHSDCLRSCI